MPLSQRIAPHLPYLRRYARAVTGSQQSGDAYVATTLEALIADVSSFPETGSDRVSLYKVFAAVFGSVQMDIPNLDSPFAWERRATANLAMLPSPERQAFLLTSVEGFAPEETAQILDVPVDEVEVLLSDAARNISQQIATDILIIEDEPLIAMDIEHIVTELGHRVCGVARTHKEAVELFTRKKPRMILADIQLADGSSGIDAVNDILKSEPMPAIFITAFPERLLTGERPEPAFLITKPFNPDMVRALISQALFFDQTVEAAA
ncbi:response regulator [Stappia indica]|uniref:DNA-directed RNA polymerase specialized sigma subunit, sigma24 family n=1 Tax=Stappia indica TaxID=538381 RepID=A0A285SFR4_9HYPH|nr:response regulator [Stappia indica]MCC4245109.1 response regulator [Stappia indica]SOC06601.1 DNA-directed RNA polymerase specialized sigma subunit, sigma24 family [Stappia indica]